MTKYILTEDELKNLIKDSLTLEALENGGVDNWDWYCDSIHEHSDYDEESGEFNVDSYLEKYTKVEDGKESN